MPAKPGLGEGIRGFPEAKQVSAGARRLPSAAVTPGPGDSPPLVLLVPEQSPLWDWGQSQQHRGVACPPHGRHCVRVSVNQWLREAANQPTGQRRAPSCLGQAQQDASGEGRVLFVIQQEFIEHLRYARHRAGGTAGSRTPRPLSLWDSQSDGGQAVDKDTSKQPRPR